MARQNITSIIGRTRELKILQRIFSSKDPEFLAIYGRRRIGKTYLIKEFFSKATKKDIYFCTTGIQKSGTSEQLDRFIKNLGAAFYKGTELKKQTNWLSAFDSLQDAIEKHTDKNQKIVLFLTSCL